MSFTGTQLDAFAQLATALGILTDGESPNAAWFADPVGQASGAGNQRGLRTILANDEQREALLAFVDEVLGAPDRTERDGATWVPLFRETTPQVTIYAVVKAVAGAVHLGVGIEHATTGAAPTVATRLHVPIFQLARGTGSGPADSDGLPGWLLLGRVGGRIAVSVDLTLRDGAPPAGEASLGGLALGLDVPTSASDVVGFALTLRDLQLPGASAPRTFALDGDSLPELQADAFALIVGLVRAQAEALDVTQPTLRPFAALTGLLGLREVAGLPPLPLADLTTQGLPALVGWIEGVLLSTSARTAWLQQLALLSGATVDVPRTAVSATIGPVTFAIGVRVAPGTGGHPVLTPWAELALDSRAGARVRLAADLLRADTQAGTVSAIPDLRAEAVFGQDAGGAPLLTGDPAVGSLHVGVGVTGLATEARRPAFVLTLEEVTLAGRHHPHLDLSSPEAALDAASTVVNDALANALAGLGAAGALVSRLLGLTPPAGITALSAPALVANPVAEIARYWRDLSLSAPAMSEVLGHVRPLLVGGASAPVPGAGTRLDPWRVPLVGPLALRVWRDGDELVVDAAAAIVTPVFDAYEVEATLGVSVLRAGFSPARATFVGAAQGRLELRRTDGALATLELANVALEARRLALDVGWSPATGVRVAFDAESLALLVQGGVAVSPLETRIAVPLPTFDAEGRLVFPVVAWDRVEQVLAALAVELHVPPLDAALALLGWQGGVPRLTLAALVGADPAFPDVGVAIRAWLGDLALDCRRLEAALGPVAMLLSGFSRNRPFGTGSARTPYRCPIAGHRRAPGLVAWLEPGCPPTTNDLVSAFSAIHASEPPEPATLVAELAEASDTLPDVRDLLVGRDGLAAGLTLLAERWTGTDGVVVATVPAGVTTVELPGYSYDELVALGSIGALLGDVLDPLPAAVVHVDCESTWSTDRPAGRAFDLTAAATGAIPASGDGEWYVRLPLPAAAAIARPDRGAVGEQAARLAQLLSARTAPIVVVAYGAAGAAAVRAANAVAAVRDVVTVGTPWAGLAMDALRTGRSGDALRFLERLLRADAPAWSDELLAHEATPLRVMRGLVTRARALVAGEAELPASEVATGVLPSAGGETPRAGLGVHAVFGMLDADAIAMGFAAVFADGLAARLEAAQAAAGVELPHVALHVGVDVPVLDLDLGGLLVGAGVTLELASLRRPAAGIGIEAAGVRGIAFEVHLGVTDGWLVGGPGALQRDVDVRWMSAHVRLPLDGRPAGDDDVELVLHEARAFGTFRERWVVRADGDGVTATTPLPEVRVLLSQVVARLRAASPALAQLLELIGLVREGGLDPAGLDRLLYDVQDAAHTAMQDAVALATSLRALVAGATGSGATLGWTIDAGPSSSAGSATITFDLATRTLGVAMQTTSTLLPPLTLAASLSPEGPRAELAFGALDALAGGLRLVGRAGAGVSAALQLEWQRPAAAGAAVPRIVPLLPTPDAAGLQALATAALPAALVQAVAHLARGLVSATARPVLDGALDVLGMLGAPDLANVRRVRLPLALVDAPGAWLRHGLAGWRADPVGSAVTLLDAVTPLVAPGAAPGTGWPLSPEVAIRYGSDAGRLRLALDVDWAANVGGPPTTAVATRLLAGLLVGPTGSAAPILEAGVTVAGRGLRLAIAPTVRLDLLRPPPAAPMQLYPGGPGLGAALGAVAESVLPPVLNALAAHRTDAGSALVKDVGAAVFDLGGAMELREGDAFTGARLATFAADPAARLLARVPHLVNAGVSALAHALDPVAARVAVAGPTDGRLTLGVGGTGAATARPVRLVLDASGAPALVLQATLALPDVGNVVIEELRLSAAGVQIAARVGPAPVQVGALVLRPMVVVRAGTSSAGFTRTLGIGLALDAAAASSVEFRWTLDANPPSLLVITRGVGGEVPDGTPLVVATRLLAVAASLAGSVAVEQLRPVLPPRAIGALRGVVFTDVAASTALDPQLFLDLTDGLRLLARLERLLLNLATAPAADGGPLSLTIDGTVTIALAGKDAGGGKTLLGVSVTLAPNKRFAIASGDPTVELEVDASWVNGDVDPGLAIYAVEATPGAGLATFAFRPAVSIAGIGLRFSKTSGPLLDLGGVSLDAIAVHVYGEASSAGVGGGVQLELAGFAIAPAGAGGSNAVANGILNDAGAAGQANRPAFSPALAVQKAPGGDVGVSFRAGRPPGPWWVVVQRQLGPLYVERVGLDTAETNGRVSRVALLFDGRVSLFGLTAAVDQLSLTWLGGDILRIDQWAVDLQGLAVSAEMSGVSLAGGLLKTTIDGNVGYVGMLLGRFGVYGLSVFGGYTNQSGSPSFFVFGAVNGPIGGPPAFFLTGIGGGLGINRGLRVPSDMSRFNEYPFIQALDVAAVVPEPMEKLRELTQYFPPQLGNFWFAAGISFTCFALVDGIAVVAVSFGTGLEINLMGLARMALPRPQAALVSIELGLLARFSTTEGLFSIQAQLTENSWLLYREVRLTGGFAFVTWWKGALAGQFVLTIGGYHPSFHREGYPVVPRVGLIWRVTDDIVIKGGAYFALTSEALMAGVDVEVSADFGWAWARIAFGAHGIVYFDPFWFEVMAYARIAAGVKIKTWLGTIRFSISMGARIKVWGPDFSGEATLEVGPCDITVGFGSERRIPPRVLDWTEFTDKYLENAGDAARVLSSITGKGTLPASTKGGQSAPTPDGTVDLPFEVFAEFELSIVTTVPTQRFEIGLASGAVTVPVTRSDGAGAALGLKPMQAGGLQSTLRLTLEKLTRSASGAVTGATSIPQQLRQLAEHRETGTDAFPIGAWGAPDPVGLEEKPLPQGDVLFAGSRLRLEAVATQLERGPEIDYYRVEASRRPLPLQAKGNSRPRLLDRAETVALPTVANAAQALLAARAQLFAARADTDAPGLLARGARTQLARATFAGDRAAPPMFGTLADGLARANGADASATVQLPPTPTAPPPMRPPRVVAWMTAGTGVAGRETPTTVKDRRIKRRVAPTLLSVQTRLATHLPVQMVATPRPATERGRTVVPTATVPRTDAPGAAQSYVAGRVGGLRGLNAVVGGLAGTPVEGPNGVRAAEQEPQHLASGDLVVLSMPDASRDVDERATARPVLAVAGGARVTMVRGDGAVLLDTVAGADPAARVTELPVPPGTAVVGVQSDARLDVVDGLAGWHEQARVASLGSHLALGTGCTLTIEAARAAPQVGWMAAADVVRDAAAVTTRFDRSVRTVVVIVGDAEGDRLDGIALTLRGATRVLQRDGTPRQPTVVLAGAYAALVYAVDPGEDGAVLVSVRAGGDYRIAGVLAGTQAVDQVARLLAERGITAVAGRMLAGTGAGCSVRWIAPRVTTPPPVGPTPGAPPVRDPRTPRKTPAKTVAKTAAKKTTTTKGAVRAPADPLPSAAPKRTTPSGGRGNGRR